MSKKNKCVGLDCEMCGNTKCPNEEKETIINGIDVSGYFIEVVDEGGSTINYKILPNFERLLVERIFEQNQQLKRLQQELDIKEKMLDKFMIGSGEILEKLQRENKRLQMLSCANCGEKYLSPEGAELYDKMRDYKDALEEVLKILCNGRTFYEGYFDNPNLSRTDEAIKVINEVLNES